MRARYYLAGPMRGHENFNFPAFDEAKRIIEGLDDGLGSMLIEVVSPADMDRRDGSVIETGVGTPDYKVELAPSFDWYETMEKDLAVLARCDGLILLPTWGLSHGAVTEVKAAMSQGKPIFQFHPEKPFNGGTRYLSRCPYPELEMVLETIAFQDETHDLATWDAAAYKIADELARVTVDVQELAGSTINHSKWLRKSIDFLIRDWPMHTFTEHHVDVIVDMASIAAEYLAEAESKSIRSVFKDVAALAADKQASYGPQNILSFGGNGIVVRLSDKVARIENMTAKARTGEEIGEPLEDAYRDIIGYAIVALMLERGQFELPLERDLQDTPQDRPVIEGTELQQQRFNQKVSV